MKKIILFCLLYYILIYSASAQQKIIDSLLDILKSTNEDTNKVKTLNQLTNIYIYSPPLDYNKALPAAEQSFRLAEKISFKRGSFIANRNLGVIYEYLGMYEKGLENILNELKIAEVINDSNKILQAHRDLVNTYSLLNNYQKELSEAAIIERRIETSGNKQEIAYSLWDEAKAYINLCKEAVKKQDSNSANTNYMLAIEREKKALNLVTELKDSSDMAFFNNCLAYVYDKCNLADDPTIIKKTGLIKFDYYDLSLRSDSNALKIYKTINVKDGVAVCYGNFGLFYRNQGDLFKATAAATLSEINYNRSLDYYLKVLNIIRELGFKHGIANYSKEVSIAYLKLGEWEKAQKFMQDAATGFDEVGHKEGAKDCYEKLSEIDYKTGHYKNAFEEYQRFSAIKDSILNKEKSKQLIEMNVKYETGKKDAELIAEQALTKNEKEKRYLVLASGGVIVVSGAFIGLILFRRNQSKHSLFTQQLENKILRAQLNPHFIFNALNSIQSFIRNHPETADSYLTKFSRLMREVLENSEQELIPLVEEISMLKKYMDIESLRVKNGFDYEISINPLIDEDNLKVPPLILQPIIENAIWHGIANYSGRSKILISASLKNKILECNIENNCKGIETTAEVKNEKKKSLGLSIIKERLSLLSKENKVKGYLRIIQIQNGMQVQLGIPV